jgi:hypothetical protein
VWNDDHQCFESTPEQESDNPFANGFLLQPNHPSYIPFKHQQKATDDDKDVGYYTIPGAYLGYKPTETPKVHLQRISIPPELLFNKASVHDPDTLTWEQAMSEEPENVKKWLELAEKEIVQLEGKETWDKVPLSTPTVKAIPGTWIFRRKRSPDGTITKWKARWVLRGDLQDVDFDTYASVVAWSTVRIFMVLGLILRWTVKALDFDNAKRTRREYSVGLRW